MGDKAKITAKTKPSNDKKSAAKSQHPDFSRSMKPSTAHSLFLQRTVGNQAVRKLIKSGSVHPKLKISQPNDNYEQEANRVAEIVIRRPDAKPPIRLHEEKAQFEQNGVARSKPFTPLDDQYSCHKYDVKFEQSTGNPPNVRNKSDSSISSPRKIVNTLRPPGSGSPLPERVRSKVEPVVGSDLSHVKVHSDDNAAQAAKSINARAFTYHHNIFLGKGQNINDIGLMAHESAHVLQQNSSMTNQVQRSPEEQTYSRTTIQPYVKGKFLGVWEETVSSAELIGGDEIQRPAQAKGHIEEGFPTLQDALAYAGVFIASHDADGGVIIRSGGRFYAFTIISNAWVYEFSRQNIEGGCGDQILTKDSEVKGIQAFVTTDGYEVPPTMSPSPSPRIPVHIVRRRYRGRYYHPTKAPTEEGFKTLLSDIEERRALKLDEEGYIALFKGLLRAKALKQLDINRKRLQEEKAKFLGGKKVGKNLQYLKRVMAKDKELLQRQEDIQDRINEANIEAGRASELSLWGPENQFRAQQKKEDKMRVLLPLMKEVKDARMTLRVFFPALAALGEKDLPETTPDKELLQHISAGFMDIQKAIDDVKNRVHEEDIPLTKLGPIVEQTKKEMGISKNKDDPMSMAILDWLETQDTVEGTITIGGTLASIVLNIGAFFASGGTSLLLYIGGAAIGTATGAYEFEIAEDINRASQAEVAGGKLIEDPSAAHLHYVMSLVNLVLAGIDVALTVKVGTTLTKSSRLSKALADVPGGEIFAELTPEQIVKFDKAMQLHQTGNAENAERILSSLRRELGEDVFSRAEVLFKLGADPLARFSDDILRRFAQIKINGKMLTPDELQEAMRSWAIVEHEVAEAAGGQAALRGYYIPAGPDDFVEVPEIGLLGGKPFKLSGPAYPDINRGLIVVGKDAIRGTPIRGIDHSLRTIVRHEIGEVLEMTAPRWQQFGGIEVSHWRSSARGALLPGTSKAEKILLLEDARMLGMPDEIFHALLKELGIL